MNNPAIYWYRADLRLTDLPALVAASKQGPVIPVFVLDEQLGGDWRPGGATRWWLHHSLQSLKSDLRARGGDLVLRRGETTTALKELMEETGAQHIYASRQYQPWSQSLESAVKSLAESHGGDFKRYPGTLIFEPEEITTGGGTPFKVFTPFWRACLKAREPSQPVAAPTLTFVDTPPESLSLDELKLLPREPNWAAGWEALWSPGEAGADRALQGFLEGHVNDYGEGRDFPAQPNTSRLSPHLKFGEISPRQIWAAAQHLKHAEASSSVSIDKFLAEIGWREFCNHLVAQFPEMPDRAFNAKFDHFPWGENPGYLEAWQQGVTGYPIVDAGMRELWQTGFMHNRVRMVVASFLSKHLLTHWRLGELWFWDCLLDADLASNACSWQWVGGSGADASPYFRIFNPVAQGEKFDKSGDYTRRWVPEIAELPDKYLHKPWEAPALILETAGIKLGGTYPAPIVDHKEARETALGAYAELRAQFSD
jgi:deoxyribodipyrimidine photo-lyase